nr:retrovirus-related Pol polyprotein from transposon TNT 1-94 [Tanacetum cinerariifolium]
VLIVNVVFLIVDQSIIYSVSTNVDTTYSSKSGNGIKHQTSTASTPEQNSIVKRRNRTLVEAARTMLSAAKVPLFFWAKATATSCFTQNRSLVIPRHEKTSYHIINGRKPSVKFFHIFGSLWYTVRDGENLDKMKEKGDACIFVGYCTMSRAYRVYNKRTRLIVETIHVNFDELPLRASDHISDSQLQPLITKIKVYKNITVILFSIHSDDGNPSSVNIKQHCGRPSVNDRPSNTDGPKDEVSGFAKSKKGTKDSGSSKSKKGSKDSNGCLWVLRCSTLNNKETLKILTAVGIDLNNGIYPLAYVLVEGETKDSWKWFLDSLGDDLKLFRNSNFYLHN